MNFRVIIEQDEDGVFVASVPAIPGCHTQGATYEDAVENVKEAIELCLEVAKDDRGYEQRLTGAKRRIRTDFLESCIVTPIHLRCDIVLTPRDIFLASKTHY